MQYLKCAQCGEHVMKSSTCPRCGHKHPKSLAAIAGFVLAGLVGGILLLILLYGSYNRYLEKSRSETAAAVPQVEQQDAHKRIMTAVTGNWQQQGRELVVDFRDGKSVFRVGGQDINANIEAVDTVRSVVNVGIRLGGDQVTWQLQPVAVGEERRLLLTLHDGAQQTFSLAGMPGGTAAKVAEAPASQRAPGSQTLFETRSEELKLAHWEADQAGNEIKANKAGQEAHAYVNEPGREAVDWIGEVERIVAPNAFVDNYFVMLKHGKHDYRLVLNSEAAINYAADLSPGDIVIFSGVLGEERTFMPEMPNRYGNSYEFVPARFKRIQDSGWVIQ